ncbi:hypothetical protein [Streptomyces viridochromogenes]|uniref:hypothetical protein n=1 Tax=Streptomyces viridochromogenes TaxID=1938 RepID=UPI00065C8447|nr:hypothetical protein [Streptomyces viridochromogenes]
MTAPHRYREVRLPPTEEPLALMVWLARSGLFDPYVVYERLDEWSFAGGALASVRLDAGARSLSAVEERLAALEVEGWRAYGWAAFELGIALAGCTPGTDSDLLHLMVPCDEVRAGRHGVLVRSVSTEGLDRLVSLVTAGGESASEPAGRIGLAVADTGNYRAAVAAALVDLHADSPLQKVVLSRHTPGSPGPARAGRRHRRGSGITPGHSPGNMNGQTRSPLPSW